MDKTTEEKMETMKLHPAAGGDAPQIRPLKDDGENVWISRRTYNRINRNGLEMETESGKRVLVDD